MDGTSCHYYHLLNLLSFSLLSPSFLTLTFILDLNPHSFALDEFLKIDKSTVLQECRVFNETPIKPRRCCLILTKLIALITSGESISNTEATDAFFSVTKLFQSSDPSLRRLVYLSIKELSALSENVIMATSSLMKDMNSKSELMHRANSLRALRKITDVR